mmetsp:Transcript_16004/g.51110  ORF Transcript_16004/g.51110 Transcript_16004/m.51110 type:complete len:297 (-) Transcript_16004:193-1083(-)
MHALRHGGSDYLHSVCGRAPSPTSGELEKCAGGRRRTRRRIKDLMRRCAGLAGELQGLPPQGVGTLQRLNPAGAMAVTACLRSFGTSSPASSWQEVLGILLIVLGSAWEHRDVVSGIASSASSLAGTRGFPMFFAICFTALVAQPFAFAILQVAGREHGVLRLLFYSSLCSLVLNVCFMSWKAMASIEQEPKLLMPSTQLQWLKVVVFGVVPGACLHTAVVCSCVWNTAVGTTATGNMKGVLRHVAEMLQNGTLGTSSVWLHKGVWANLAGIVIYFADLFVLRQGQMRSEAKTKTW